jgi:hypothetical protein
MSVPVLSLKNSPANCFYAVSTDGRLFQWSGKVRQRRCAAGLEEWGRCACLDVEDQMKVPDGAKHTVIGFVGKPAEQGGAGLILFDQSQRAVACGAYVVDRWHVPSPMVQAPELQSVPIASKFGPAKLATPCHVTSVTSVTLMW